MFEALIMSRVHYKTLQDLIKKVVDMHWGACEEINLANVGHPTALGAGVENGNKRPLSLVEAVI